MKLIPSRRAFTLIELLVVIAIIALLVGILMPSLSEARKNAKLIVDSVNLKNSGIAQANYATDFKDVGPAFSWTQYGRYPNTTGIPPSGYTSDNDAAMHQAVDILRRRSRNPGLMLQGPWTPHVLYTHLVILDYLGTRLPEPIMISPGDRLRKIWAEDPTAATASLSVPAIGSPANERWPYSSSYMTTPASYTPDVADANGVQARQGPEHFNFLLPSSNAYRYGPQKRSDVAFASQKVYMHDQQMRFFGKFDAPFLWRGAKVNCLFFDSSVRVSTTGESNLGGYALASTTWETPNFEYKPTPEVGESIWPGDPNGAFGLTGRYRWTAKQKQGIDFGGQNPFWQRFPGRTGTAPN